MKLLRKTLDFLATYGWATTLVVLALFAFGFTWSSSDKLYSNIRLFDRIALMVSQNYVEDIDEEKMIKAGIDAMLSKLDNYTKFLQDADYLRLMQETDGQFKGIGVGMEYHRDTLTIVSVIDDTPGSRAELKPGDRVLRIDSTSTFGLDVKKIRTLLWGNTGVELSLLVLSPRETERQVKIKRENVTIVSVPYYSMISGDIGYIRLSHFSDNCFDEMKTAIKKLVKEGMLDLVVDLRGNPGGLLIEAVEIAGMFLPNNSEIVETRARDGAIVSSFVSNIDPIFPEGDLAIIVDNQTASAAEIVAGAIQDHDRGIIIGTETYGKGLVQQVLQFSGQSALKITTSKYHLPSGRCLQKPDWSSFELLANKPKRSTDSLYFTASGRVVFGGGGIIPDIFVESVAESRYMEALIKEACFFDFTIEYLLDNKIESDFVIDDTIMREFKTFVAERGFAFMEEDRVIYNNLKDKISFFDNDTKAALALIEEKLNSKELWYFDNHYDEIRTVLNEEIIFQSRGEKALYNHVWLKNHDEIKVAREILDNSQEYISILVSR